MAKTKVSEQTSEPKKDHKMSLSEFGVIVGMSIVVKAGFRVWVKGAKNGVGSHTQPEWDKLYKQFLTSK